MTIVNNDRFIDWSFNNNMCLALTLLVGRVFCSLFFGKLRSTETEFLVEKAKYVITETCLALTIFRNELSPSIIALFATLIFFKLFHRLAKCRAEYIEQILPISKMANFRIFLLFTFLLGIDLCGIYGSVNYIMETGKSVVILFGFEFG